MANPTLITTPIAENGAKNAIPNTVDPSTGALSQEKGWDEINSIPLTDGGKAPDRLDFNGVFNLLSKILFYAQKGWQFEWDSSQAYYAGCIVKDTSDNKMYQCLNDITSTTAPHSDTTNWQLWDLSAYLPLSGGTMEGNTFHNADIIMKDEQWIRSFDDTKLLRLTGGGGPYSGGSLTLYGRTRDDSNAGAFSLSAVVAGASEKSLFGYADGTLTWDGNDLAGSAIVAKSMGTTNGYVKESSGEIRQWGVTTGIGSGGTAQVTFPISFGGTTRFGLATAPSNGSTEPTSMTQYEVYDVTYTGFKIKALEYLPYGVRWLAYGY